MEHIIKACRVCLATDVKMYDMLEYQLENYYASLVGITEPICLVELPSYACFECASLIQKYHLFREKCLRGQTMFHDILQRQGHITINEIKQIDRKKFRLTSNLSSSNIFEAINLKIELHSDKNDEFRNITINEIKQIDRKKLRDTSKLSRHNILEAIDLKNELHSDKKDVTENNPLVENQADSVFEMEIDIDVNKIKEENDYSVIPSPTPPSSAEDDEPLSLHRSVKEKKKNKGRKRKKETESIEDKSNILQLTDLNNSSNPQTESLLVEVKRARGRPRKTLEIKKEQTVAKQRRTKNTGGVLADEINIEDYAVITTLSMEEQMREINSRQQSANYQNAPFKCSLCFKGFIDTKAWKHHLNKHSPNAGDVQCRVCKFRFKTKRALQKHASNHEKKYHCKSCSYVSRTTTQAKHHLKWHKGVTYKCQYCDEISTKWTSYLSHLRLKHPSEFICGICGYSFVSKLGLSMHKSMMHKELIKQEDEEKGPYCTECDVQFVSEEAWKRHMVTSVKHTEKNELSHGCRVCGESFKSAEELRLHHRKEHARKRPKNYGKKHTSMEFPAQCEHCTEEISNARDYWAHFRRVHPDKKYPIQKSYICEICGKSFRGNAFLVYHKRTHFEERAYKCAQCPKAFFNRTNLQMHEKTHSDHRPYPCSVCFKAFKCKGALDRHFRSHTGVKPYECAFCGKAFGQSNSCKLHVQTVHLKQPAPYVSRSRQQRRRTAVPGKEAPDSLLTYAAKKPTEMYIC